MSYSVSLQRRLQQLKQAQADLPAVLSCVAKDATQRAVEAAAEATPPTMGNLRGTNTRTGALKQAWQRDSQIMPAVFGNGVITELRNNQQYAAYVDQGHRMDRHFVPGLYINEESGMLEYDPAAKVGLVVGTRTKYVKGKFMTDKGKRAYEETVLKELDKEIRGLMG